MSQHWFLAPGFHLKFSITLEKFHISHYVRSRRGKEEKRAKESVRVGCLTGLLRVSFFLLHTVAESFKRIDE